MTTQYPVYGLAIDHEETHGPVIHDIGDAISESFRLVDAGHTVTLIKINSDDSFQGLYTIIPPPKPFDARGIAEWMRDS